MQNPFTNTAFSMTALTNAMNILPVNYGRVENLNLFPSRSVRFRHITIEEQNGVLSLLPTQVPGAPATVGKRGKRKVRTFTISPIRKELLAPAVFVELSSFEKGHDPGTEELALKARFEARIVIDSTIENAAIIVRSLASEVAKVVNKNTWNVENVSPGEFISGGGDDFRPELDAYLVWLVEWTHEVHAGKSVWSTGIMPHVIDIGEVHVRP